MGLGNDFSLQSVVSWNVDTLDIKLPIDFAIFYQIMQSTSSTESYNEGFTLIARIIHKIMSNAV